MIQLFNLLIYGLQLGARVADIAGNLEPLASHRYDRIDIQVGANDIHLWQSEVTKNRSQ